MSKVGVIFSTIAVLAALLVTSGAAQAQATRTWVSGVGDDANPCSRTAPCKTFAGAISKTAACGEIDALDDGGFGAVTITKCMTINGGGHTAGVLVSGTNGIIVAAGTNDNVILRNLDINGIGTGLNGIRFTSGKSLLVEECQIYGFTGAGIDFEPSAASTLAVNECTVSYNAGAGVLVKPQAGGSAAATLNEVFAFNNQNGFRAEDNSKVSVKNSIAASNANNGYLALYTGPTTPSVELNIVDSLAMDHSGAFSAGVRSSGASATVRMDNISTFNNTNGLLSFGGGTLVGTNPGTNMDAGNGSTVATSSTAGLK